MEIRTTKVFEKNLEAWVSGKRRALNEGGTYSSKTWSILQLIILIAQHAKSNLLISVVSESLPHLRRGAIRDFFNILGESQDNNPQWNKSTHTYNFGRGRVEFFGANESDKVRGPRRDILFINEANNIPWETARGLDIRTKKFTFVDWNPTNVFWVHEYESGGKRVPGWIKDPKNNAYIHSTYKDALSVLSPEVVANIESNKNDPNWWNVYGLGKLGKIKGLVYPSFEIVKELPQGDYFYGLDFGFSTDPSVLVKNVIVGDALYSQQIFYETGLTNPQIVKKMEEAGVRKNYDEIFADSAEPKSIAEIYQAGFNIKGVKKGPGSVEYRHQKVRQYKQYWTEDSLECIKEQRNFRYIEDMNGNLTDKTTHKFSHGMDARDYAVIGKVDGAVEEYTVEKVVVYNAMDLIDIDF